MVGASANGWPRRRPLLGCAEGVRAGRAPGPGGPGPRADPPTPPQTPQHTPWDPLEKAFEAARLGPAWRGPRGVRTGVTWAVKLGRVGHLSGTCGVGGAGREEGQPGPAAWASRSFILSINMGRPARAEGAGGRRRGRELGVEAERGSARPWRAGARPAQRILEHSHKGENEDLEPGQPGGSW